MKSLEGKVAKILNSRELVINIGKSAGVEVGMVFKVLDQEEINIRDPVTGENLGSLERTKAKVKVDFVKDNMSVAKTFRKETINVGGSATGLLAAAHSFSNIAEQLVPPKWIDKYETLRLPEDFEPLDETDSIVSVGDIVVLTAEEEDSQELVAHEAISVDVG